MSIQNKRGINTIVIVFFILILVIAAVIVMFSFTSTRAPQQSSSPAPSSPAVSTGADALPPPGANVAVEAQKQCTVSCDDSNSCTRDFCNAVYGECDHEVIAGCCGNKICDGSETCLESGPGADNSKACTVDCGTCTVVSNEPPAGWCTADLLDASLRPPYVGAKPSLSGSRASLEIDVLNPSDFDAKNVMVEVYPSAGFDVDPGQSLSSSLGVIPLSGSKSVAFSFSKQTGAVLGYSNPTAIKLTYLLNGKTAVVCTQVGFS